MLFFMLMAGIPALANASPPRDLQLKYNTQTHTLDINVKHPTAELRENFIRTITIAINGQEPQIFRFPFQRAASEFETSISLELHAGDNIVVKATCSQGGSTSAELIIPSEESKSEK